MIMRKYLGCGNGQSEAQLQCSSVGTTIPVSASGLQGAGTFAARRHHSCMEHATKALSVTVTVTELEELLHTSFCFVQKALSFYFHLFVFFLTDVDRRN